jgi:hypothetical protein
MSARNRMTHRALVERATYTTDAYGPTWATHIAAQPCYFWEPTGQRGEIVGPRNADSYAHRLIVPLDTAITEEDRISGVVDRRARVITASVFNITQLVRKPDHLLLVLEVVES